MSEFKGAFLGFSFKGTHSSDLKIVRTNIGDRAEMALSPNFDDSTVSIKGRDGVVYFDTQLQKLDLSVNFAFDSLLETDIVNLRRFFAPKETGKLVFDEYPYKEYEAKIGNGVKLSYIVFDEGDDKERVYKGEGSVLFSCFTPCASAPYKTIEQYNVALGAVKEWEVVSGIKKDAFYTGIYDTIINQKALLYNPGDLDSPLTISFTVASTPSVIVLSLYEGLTRRSSLCLDGSKLAVGAKVVIDATTGLIRQTLAGVTTLRNDVIIAGEMLKVKRTQGIAQGVNQEFAINSTQGLTGISIDYKYLYY